MTLDKSYHPTQLTPGGPAVALDLQKITIYVNSNGTFSPSTYTTEEGAPCAVVPASGSTFTGDVQVWLGTKLLATWEVGAAYSYVVPTPKPSTPPSTTCTLTSVPSGGGTNSNGTINIGTHPPLRAGGAGAAKAD